MYQVSKVLNNNGILTVEQESGTEYIFLGKGIGFSCKEKMQFVTLPGVKKYKFQPEQNKDASRYSELTHSLVLEIEKKIGRKLDSKSLSYTRLMTHINYMILRLQKGEQLKVEINAYVKSEFPESYKRAEELCAMLTKELGQEPPESEIGYLAIHLERVKQ